MTAEFGTPWAGGRGRSRGYRGGGPVGGNRLGLEGRCARETGGMAGTTRGDGPTLSTDGRLVLGGGISIRPTVLSSPDGAVGGSLSSGYNFSGNPSDYWWGFLTEWTWRTGPWLDRIPSRACSNRAPRDGAIRSPVHVVGLHRPHGTIETGPLLVLSGDARTLPNSCGDHTLETHI